VPWVQPWANVPAPLGLPKNAATGRAYSGVNVLILWVACLERGFGTQNWLRFFADGAAKKWPLRGSLREATGSM